MSMASSVRWVALAQGARVGSQLVSLVVLARLLPPQTYGLIAMAMTVTNLAFMFRELGTMATIVQRPVLGERLKSTLYWVNVALALAIAAAMVALAGPISIAYGEPELVPIVRVLALSVPLSSIAAVQQALMERDSQFRTLARIEAVSAVAGVLTAIAIAANGGGAWSLVWQMLVLTGLTALQSWRASAWRPRRLFDLAELRTIFGFVGNYSLFQFVTYLQRNADSVIVGKTLGSATLGVYAMASKVMLFPLQNITGIATRVLLPAMSRRQHAGAELGALFLRAGAAISMLTAPLMAGLYYLRAPFVDLVFGPRWHEAAGLLQWLAPSGFIQSLHAPTTALLLALGKASLLLRLSLLNTVVQVACLLLAVRWGLRGAGAGILAASCLMLAPALACVMSSLKLAPLTVLAELGKPVLAAAFMLLALALLDTMAVTAGLGKLLSFAVNVAAGALAYVFALLVLLRQDMTDMRALFRLRQA
ncbi:MAG: lipopolysaccharide biosynthesis protein [Massilia sp.]